MKPKSMGVKMSRMAFIELYKWLQKLGNLHAMTNAFDATNAIQQMGFPSKYIVEDFLVRNEDKFAKVGNIVDEAIQFPVGSIVEFKPSEIGDRADDNVYYVIRARKTPSGKREYWLWDITNPRPLAGRRINPDRKVGSASLVASNHYNNAAAYFSGCKLPKPT